MSSTEKYSMIFHQDDRLEFRFFSPTLEADKLNHYVNLANTVYKRLAGKNAKLSKKTASYLYNKMTAINGLTKERAIDTLNKVNNLLSAESYKVNEAKDESTSDPVQTARTTIELVEQLTRMENMMYQISGVSNPEFNGEFHGTTSPNVIIDEVA
jgi:hypothetical protein